MASPKLNSRQVSPPTEVDGGSGEHTPGQEVVAYKSRGLDIFRHAPKDDDLSGGGANTLVGSWWGSSGRAGTRPWHNSPK